ncbi:mandelate racemase/muconate lactonizing enzyme family protein [Bosea caraganae]|uniref:Mandelate racemase/muconate lactonizing enzyme family protein n=1 Tax=Bosea caraganae TaxID=2763117 RepID=A0A370LBJ3_9HYPH|nr:mandelate racemase/muconate lactonizing enzyme family protein [Bosea caraganae]RDJ21693.1 mandelate racemase/muconate lactonizing enzyme family protein [Bosea caraganae]RDJ28276.1 mandelate racemase/muconate lactonizing enzyme family protein [Bosea caraganae]
MKITELRIHPLSMEFEKLLWTAHEPFDKAQLILVEIRTDTGLVGIGEISTGPQSVVCDLLAKLAPVIKGMDPLAPNEIWQKLFSITVPRPGGIGGWDGLPPPLPRGQRPQFMAAMAGIDIALWDIRGKATNLPVFRLLGGTRTDVFTYAVGGFYNESESPFACAEELGEYVSRGFRAVKLKTGALSLADEVKRVRAVRETIGPDVLLMLDLNAPYDVEGCIRFAHAVAPYDIFWLEEPLHWYLQPADFVRLAAASPIPLAHGEREWHRFTVRDFIDSGAVRYVQFDCTRYAGFSEALRISDYAQMQGVMVAPHTAAHLHAHLVSAAGDKAFGAESVGRDALHPIHHRIFHGGAVYRDGRVHLSEQPGFGLEVDWRAVEALKG